MSCVSPAFPSNDSLVHTVSSFLWLQVGSGVSERRESRFGRSGGISVYRCHVGSAFFLIPGRMESLSSLRDDIPAATADNQQEFNQALNVF